MRLHSLAGMPFLHLRWTLERAGTLSPAVESLPTRTPVGGRTGEQCRRPRNETATLPCRYPNIGWLLG